MTIIQSMNITGIEAQEEEVTPSIAEAYLLRNRSNRPVYRPWIDALVDAIKRGEFLANAETIKFDEEGNLIDGQHRLQAVVEAGVPVTMLVARGVPQQSVFSIDLSRRRTLPQTLRMLGELDATILSGAIGWLYRLPDMFGSRRSTSVAQRHPTVIQGLNMLEENPGLRDSTRVALRAHRGSGIAPSVGAALYYLFSTVDEESAEEFFDLLATGDGLSAGHPIFVLRASAHKWQSKPKALRPRPYHIAAIIIKAWNAYVEGREVGQYSFAPGGAKNEAFPRILGYE